jgi:hypothetical protein
VPLPIVITAPEICNFCKALAVNAVFTNLGPSIFLHDKYFQPRPTARLRTARTAPWATWEARTAPWAPRTARTEVSFYIKAFGILS